MTVTQQNRKLQLAMSELYLDTETRVFVPALALEFVRSQMTAQELRDIWRYEVTPAVSGNLRSVAGEAFGFDAEWLSQRIEEKRIKPPRGRLMAWIAEARYRWASGEAHFQFEAALTLCDRLRSLARDLQEPRAQLWTALLRILLGLENGSDWHRKLVEAAEACGMNAAAVQRAFREDLQPIVRTMYPKNDPYLEEMEPEMTEAIHAAMLENGATTVFDPDAEDTQPPLA
jgi:hypothetical protein